eukprot:SAG11_NODE_512_length_8839_cov_5.600572_5_plen_49_part_00
MKPRAIVRSVSSSVKEELVASSIVHWYHSAHSALSLGSGEAWRATPSS